MLIALVLDAKSKSSFLSNVLDVVFVLFDFFATFSFLDDEDDRDDLVAVPFVFF